MALDEAVIRLGIRDFVADLDLIDRFAAAVSHEDRGVTREAVHAPGSCTLAAGSGSSDLGCDGRRTEVSQRTGAGSGGDCTSSTMKSMAAGTATQTSAYPEAERRRRGSPAPDRSPASPAR
jgi:hypothetical protein